MLEAKWSRQRQQRLLKEMARRKLDAVVVGRPEHVYYFSAIKPHWLQAGAFVLFADGRSWLTSGNKPAIDAVADDAVSYEASWFSTLRQEQPAVVAQQVIDQLKSRRAREVGIDSSAVTAQVAMRLDDVGVEPIDPVLWQMRRVKDPDELALMRDALRVAEAMYARSREIVAPGADEVEVFAQLSETAIRAAGEPLAALLGNDFTSGGGDGPPRRGRKMKAGEIYVLDVGPCYRGYFSDVCRSIAVDRKPTDAQMKAWQAIVEALAMVERLAKPGARCRQIYEEVAAHLHQGREKGLTHHLGHGVGLQPHEYPHLNPKWDDVLMEGEVFSAEPGLYGPELAGGIRIENAYVVTSNGVRRMSDSPMELT